MRIHQRRPTHKRRLVGLGWCELVGNNNANNTLLRHQLSQKVVVWRKCHSEHVQITLNKTWKLPSPVFTGRKLRPAGIGIEAPAYGIQYCCVGFYLENARNLLIGLVLFVCRVHHQSSVMFQFIVVPPQHLNRRHECLYVCEIYYLMMLLVLAQLFLFTY